MTLLGVGERKIKLVPVLQRPKSSWGETNMRAQYQVLNPTIEVSIGCLLILPGSALS